MALGDYNAFKRSYSDKTADIVLSSGGTGTIVPKTSKHTLFIQKVTGNIDTHANAKLITMSDGTITVTLIHDLTKAAGVPDTFTVDFGPAGMAMTQGATVTFASESAGPVGDLHVECYEKLTGVISYLAGAASQ